MKKLIYPALIFLVLSCTEEQLLTTREHAFIKSLEVSTSAEKITNVTFEVLDKGKAGINGYGVDYIEAGRLKNQDNAPFEYFNVSQSGAPSDRIITVGLINDILANVEYLARPYVISSGKKIYGEALSFKSGGSPSPIIVSISTEILKDKTPFTIEGNYFSSILDRNKLEIPELGEKVRMEITHISNEQIRGIIHLNTNFGKFKVSDKKYDLKITSGSQTFHFPSHFRLVYPFITEISKSSGSVGEKIDLEVTFPENLQTGKIWISQEGSEQLVTAETRLEKDGQSYFTIPDLAPGNYNLVLSDFENFESATPFRFAVKDSWQISQENIPFPEWGAYQRIVSGDQIIMVNRDRSSLNPVYIYHVPTKQMRQSSPIDWSLGGNTPLLIGDGGKYLYHGLGQRFSPEESASIDYKNFSRLNLQTGTWEKLKDFSGPTTNVNKCFFFQGKLFVSIYGISSFYIYDPQKNDWQASSFQIPAGFMNTDAFTVYEGEIIYSNPQKKSQFMSFVPGQSEKVKFETTLPTSVSVPFQLKIVGLNGKLFMAFGPRFYRVDMDGSNFTTLQTLRKYNIWNSMLLTVGGEVYRGLNYQPYDQVAPNTLFKFIQD